MRGRNEKALLAKALDVLSEDFIVWTEVPGTSIDGQRVRLDATLRPRRREQWKNPDIVLGIEAKDAAPQRHDFRNVAAWIAQCIDYSYAEWEGIGRIPIFAWPAITDYTAAHAIDVVPHLLGQFNIGELTTHPQHGYALVMHQHHRIWSQGRGVEHGKHWTLRPRVGSRRLRDA